MRIAKDNLLDIVDAITLVALENVSKLSGRLWIESDVDPTGLSVEARYWLGIQDRLEAMYQATAKEKKWKRYTPLKDLL